MELNQFRDVDIVLDKANDNIIQKQFVSAGDKDGRSLTVQITENGAVGEVIGLTLNLRWHNEASGLTDLSAFSVVDRTTSVFKIDYPQNMLTPGKVIAYIQILQDGKVTHTKPFEITVQNLAGTTRGVLATAEYGALVTTLAKANEFETEIAKKADKTQVDALGSEINVARGGAQTLGERLDSDKAEVSAQFAQKADKVALAATNTEVARKADKIYVDNRIDNVTQGGPANTFNSLSALQSAYPSGTNKPMLVLESDGVTAYVYTWTGSAWKKGVLYQAQGLTNGQVDMSKINFNEGVFIIDNNVVDFNTTAKSVTVRYDTQIACLGNVYTIPAQTIAWANEEIAWQVRYIVYNVDTKQLSAYTAAKVPALTNRDVYLFAAYTKNVIGGKNAHAVRVDGKNTLDKALTLDLRGTSVDTLTPILYEQSSFKITHDESTNQVIFECNTGYGLLQNQKGGTEYNSTASYAKVDGVFKKFVLQRTASSLRYANNVYLSKSTKDFVILDYAKKLTDDQARDYCFVMTFQGARVWSANSMELYCIIDGQIPKGPFNNSVVIDEYNWTTNSLIVPDNLYFVKGVDYAIFAQNMTFNQFFNNKNLTFELALPNQIVQFNQTASFSPKLTGEFESKLVAMYNNHEDALVKDVYLNIVDAETKKDKNIKFLTIGDSIAESRLPSYTKYWLESWGINSEGVGTLSNSNDGHGYGMIPKLPIDYARGEARGGWRLTDFTCKTPLKNGGYHVQNLPFKNPTTNEFDFSYYMTQQGFNNLDAVVIQIGTNDITGYHADGSVRAVDLDSEYLNPSSEFYLKKQYDLMINSIKAYNPNIKIILNPPMTVGLNNDLNTKYRKWAEVLIGEYRNVDNVFIASSYLYQGHLTVPYRANKASSISDLNNSRFEGISGDVHLNGMGQLVMALHVASCLVNVV